MVSNHTAVKSRSRVVFNFAAAALAFSVLAGVATPVQARPVMGINMGLQAPSNRVFTDAMKTTARKWATISNFDVAAPADANGWPTTDAQLMVWEGLASNHGTYKVTFNGQADISDSFNMAAFSNKTYNAATNTTTVTMVITDSGKQNFILRLTNTRRTSSSALNTGVTNVRMTRPTVPAAARLLRTTFSSIQGFANVMANYDHLRYMEGTNFNLQKTWADRTRPDYYTQFQFLPGQIGYEGNGPAWEYKIMFANQLNKDIWLCFPADVDDDYIRKVALMCRYGSDGTNPYTSTQTNPKYPPLNSNLNIYTEYSNETWNYSFTQYSHANQRAESEIAANPNSSLNYDGSNPKGLQAAYRFTARQAKVISDIFREVFGDAAMPAGPNGTNSNPRIRPLFEYQYKNDQGTATIGLDFLNDYYNNASGVQYVTTPRPVTYYLYGAGGSPYYNNNLDNSVNNDPATTIDQIFNSGIDVNYQETVRQIVRWSKFYGLRQIGYEGGMAVGGDSMTNNAFESRWDPRAKGWELNAMDIFARAGGDAFSFGTYAQYDFRRPIAEWNTSPLQQGVLDITNGTHVLPSPDMGTLVPGSVPGKAHNETLEATGPSQFFRTGGINRYIVRTNTAGSYNLVVKYSAWNGNDRYAVQINGGTPVYRDLAPSGGFGNNVTASAAVIPITLNRGQNGIIVRCITGDTTLHSLDFSSNNPTPTPTLLRHPQRARVALHVKCGTT
jgi:hypothetical protein